MNRLAWIVAASTCTCACGGSAPRAVEHPSVNAARGEARGPSVIAVDGDPNGLWWDDGAQTLYIADDHGNRILRWTEGAGVAIVHDVPAATSPGPGLGQLVRLSDGTIVVTRFGAGTAGDVVRLSPEGAVTVVAGLDPTRRRVGLTVTRDGRLFDAWFQRLPTDERVGGVSELTPAGETDVITGLTKAIGVLAVGDALFVSDQGAGQILNAPVSQPAQHTVLATLDSPDLLAAGPDGSLFTGGLHGVVRRVDRAGHVTEVASGFQEVRGVAYDPTQRRLFVADHDGNDADGVTNVLRIVPVN